MVQAVRWRSLTVVAWVQTQVSPNETGAGQSGSGNWYCSKYFNFPAVSITESILHNRLNINISFIRRASGQNQGTSKRNKAPYNIGQNFIENNFPVLFIV